MTTPVLAFRAVDKRVRDGRVGRTILRDVSLEVAAGSCVVVQGPSGSGKTTLLALAGLLSAPTNGEVLIEGEPTSRWRESFRANVRRARIGFVFQHAELLDDRSVLQNVLLPAAPLGIDGARRTRAEALLRRFGLSELARVRAAKLSGGERQRVALCRALLFEPKLLLCDEPTAHLDAARGGHFVELLEECAREGRAVLLATHDERLVRALPSARKLVLSEDGSIAEG